MWLGGDFVSCPSLDDIEAPSAASAPCKMKRIEYLTTFSFLPLFCLCISMPPMFDIVDIQIGLAVLERDKLNICDHPNITGL